MKRALRNRVRRRVVLTCKNGEAFRGILNEEDKQAVVLCSAELADPRGDKQWINADGEILILLADIAYMQFV